MQEHDDVFMAKYKSQRAPAPRNSASTELREPPPAVLPAYKLRWFSCIRHLVATLLKAQDLDFEKYQELEAKRTRQQIEQNRMSKYF